MIGLDMKMPEICVDCPCSYWIRTGDYAGYLMCAAMEKINPHAGDESYLVDEFGERPNNCPMREIAVVYDPS